MTATISEVTANPVHVRNILNVYNNASGDIMRSGLSWYPRANAFAASLDSDVARAAAVIAVISPNTSWTANQTLARKAYINGSGEGVGFPDKVRKVNRLFDGEDPFTVVGGPKVTAFFRRILMPYSNDVLPVIDRHAQDIADGKRNTENVRKPPAARKYLEYAKAYVDAADSVGICSSALQAITWETWRRFHGINV